MIGWEVNLGALLMGVQAALTDQERVSLFIELYKKTVSVSCVASGFLPDLALCIHHRTHRGAHYTEISC